MINVPAIMHESTESQQAPVRCSVMQGFGTHWRRESGFFYSSGTAFLILISHSLDEADISMLVNN